MKKNDMIKGFAPILKVNNRHKNVSFYQNILGFKVLNEENAFVDLGDRTSTKAKLILEESPSMRTRKVEGPKKLGQLIFKITNPDELEMLLVQGVAYERLYRGKVGWAFSSRSPEGDEILLHSESDVADLILFEGQAQFEAKLADFKGLSSLSLDSVLIHTPQSTNSERFYSQLLEGVLPVQFLEIEGEDLQVDSDQTWDLSGFDIEVDQTLSLASIQSEFEASATSFIDKKERLLVLNDPSQLAISIRR